MVLVAGAPAGFVRDRGAWVECHLDPLDARTAGRSWQEAGLVSETAVRTELPYPAPPPPAPPPTALLPSLGASYSRGLLLGPSIPLVRLSTVICDPDKVNCG